jgi:molybdopterin converting factor small subunit
MKVRVNFMGTLAKYAGVDSTEIELRDGARYGDLLSEMGKLYGRKFPTRLWDSEKCEFVRPISAIGSTGDIEARDTPLSHNEEIHFLIPISGGR